MKENISNEKQNEQSCKTGVSGSVFHPSISHVNCDENISKETINAINKMVDCVFSEEEIKESKNEFKNKYNIPVFCSTLKSSDFKIEITGYGCSLSRDHAFHRSLIELVQCYHASTKFYPESITIRNEYILSKFKNYGFHEQCSRLKIYELAVKLDVVPIGYNETANNNIHMTLDKYLESIISKVEESGDRAFYSKLFGGGNEITVCHSFIDGQDNFFAVTEGCLVFPNKLNNNLNGAYI